MQIYEIRLINRAGRTSLVYTVQCWSDDHAREKLLAIDEETYDHFEIWRGMQIVAEGGSRIIH